MGQKDEIVWLDSPNHRFWIKVAWEQLRIHRQMVEWHDIVWFKNVVPRHSFLLWMAVQQKLTTQDRLHRFVIHGPNRCSLCLRNNEDHNHLFFECAYTKAIWWDVCDIYDIPRMTKGWDEWIRWASVTWHGKSFVNFFVNRVSQLQCIMYGKNRMQGSLLGCLELRFWSLIKSNVSFAISLI